MTHGQPKAGFYKVSGYADRTTLDALQGLRVQNLSRAVSIALGEWARSRGGNGSEPRPVEE